MIPITDFLLISLAGLSDGVSLSLQCSWRCFVLTRTLLQFSIPRVSTQYAEGVPCNKK